jgi:hypothetical protein
MIGMLFRVVIVTLIIIAITAFLGLVVMAGVAGTHGVKRVDIPEDSYLSPVAETADYADAYQIPMEFNTYRDIPRVIENATIKGDDEVHRSAHEVVYRGHAPGLRYHVSYFLDRKAAPPTLAMITTVQTTGKKGRYYWKVVRPIHRCFAPYMLDRLATRATD